ncbi:MAG: hypothetical protein QNJ22_03300 [Desulfosarcinaceae bacterium]|nr:hypothetical protein [Desulfosarcinaceae bacterium]
MRRQRTIAAILALCFIAVGVVFLFQSGPGSAEAKVFERLLQWTAEMPDYDFSDAMSSGTRKTVVNGNTVWMKVSKSRDAVGQVLDFYAARYPAPKVATAAPDRLAALAEAPGRADIAESARLLTDFIQCLDGQFRMERDAWGVWGAFVPHDEALLFGEAAYIDAYADALERGDLGKMGTARIVLAMKPPSAEETRIFSLWTTRDFDLGAFQGAPGEDLGGRDIEAIPRFPNSRRLLSFEQHNARTRDSVAIYEGGGTEVQLVLFFNNRMPAAGWQSNKRIRGHQIEAATSHSDGRTIYFTRANRECVIQIHRSKRNGRVLTTIIDRTTRSG